MIKETEEERRKRLEKKKADFLRELEEEPPFDRQVYEAEMKALEGTMWETALMDPDGNICVKTWDIGAGGTRGDGGYVLRPDDDQYQECKAHYGLQKPGDSYGVVKKVINGEWVIQGPIE